MRSALFSHVKRIVVKVGSSVISDSSGIVPEVIDGISRGLCELSDKGYEVILVTSGAVSAGKGALGIEGRPKTIPLQQAAAAIGQSRLMKAYKECFIPRGHQVAQILLTRDDLANRRRYLNARNTLMTLLEFGVVPIINENDTVVVDEIRFGDNDNLSALVANLLEADLLIILSDVDGLYDRDPNRSSQAKLIPEVERITPQLEAMAGGASSNLGTGGMLTKLKAAKKAALSGIGTVVVNGRTPDVLSRLVAGDDLGTYFLPECNRMAAKKHWIAFTKKPRGKLFLDAGALLAVNEGGKSLLPSGVRGVEGSFDRGDAVRLCDMEGREFATGVVNYGLQELLRILGKRSGEIEKVLGYKYGDEVVHRDNLVLKK